ncbi:MAG: DUF4438 domain-containing protein [candidate division WOR-3 bacterium]
MKLKTNKVNLPCISVMGEVAPPKRRFPYTIDYKGEPKVFPGTGGIIYNIKVGDRVFGWVGDHLEPGVSIKVKDEDENRALNTYACIGNSAKVISGEAKGEKGFVTGKHGGIEHILVYFPEEVLEKLAIGDKIQIKAIGQGLAIEDFPWVKFYNLDPDLLARIDPVIKNGFLYFPVTHTLPPEIMGSGLGGATTSTGDYDITTQDEGMIKKWRLDELRFGDIVCLQDTDNTYGRCLRKGAVSIGVVVHANCVIAGHGPGVTTIATSSRGRIKPILNKKANIAHYLLG